MAFQLSPGVNFSEIDLTNSTPAVATTEGALAGVFRWGPTNQRTLITSETELVNRFGAPNTRFTDAANSVIWTNAETFYTAANFLGYSDALYVVRASDTALVSSVQSGSDELFEGKYEGLLGNSLSVSWCADSTAVTGAGSFVGGTLSPGASITLAAGATSAVISGVDTSVNAGLVKVGDKIKITDSDQEMTVKTVATSGDGSLGGALSFNPDSAPVNTTMTADSIDGAGKILTANTGDDDGEIATGDYVLITGAITNGSIAGYDTAGTVYEVGAVVTDTSFELKTLAGIIVESTTGGGSALGATVVKLGTGVDLANNIIQLDTEVGTIVAGTPVQYDANGASDIAGLEDDRIYFAIPVLPVGHDNAGNTATGNTTVAIKLAATAADAIAHSNTSDKAISLTELAGVTGLLSTIKTFDSFGVNVTFTSKYTGVSTLTNKAFTVKWGDHDKFDGAPESGNYHVVVRDVDGEIGGVAGAIIETYDNISSSPAAKKFDGSSNYIVNVLENNSNWIKISTANVAKFGAPFLKANSGTTMLAGSDGKDESETLGISLGKLALGYDLFKDAADVDVSFILQGKARGANGYELANYIIDNVAETRRDCVAFVSPAYEDDTIDEVVDYAAGLTASSYAVVDSGYKYQYDKYSDAYRWIPLNGDIAGLCARTDDLRDPWFSPAGYNRGNVKNVVKLQINPNKAQRDLLYKNGINPVITQPGQGTVLFGDKTYAGKSSAFDRINVRRLFIVLEKTISRAAKSTLFEFNDEFTRAQFVNLVEPFLRDVQGRRGIFDFKVVCDATNNDGQVVDTNQFVGDIYIKPARSINFIQLNFVAVRSGVEFTEIVGAA